jgi:dihydropteroate synthase
MRSSKKKSMGVINLTPNSFAKSNKFSDFDTFSNAFQKMQEWADVIDLGAESTAPFNDKVSEDTELKRFKELFFPYLEQNKDPEMQISIDTYKVSVFKAVAEKIQSLWPKSEIIFNDVSGKLDDELLNFFSETTIPFTYIFSHNGCPTRQQTNEHMNFIVKGIGMAFMKELSEFFIEGIGILNKSKIKFLIDPCFGFSKTREQNHYLLKKFNTFMLQLPTDIGCVYGISRKSFLRFPQDIDVNDESNIKVLDHTQTYFFAEILKNYPTREFLFRVHSPQALDAAHNIAAIIK